MIVCIIELPAQENKTASDTSGSKDTGNNVRLSDDQENPLKIMDTNGPTMESKSRDCCQNKVNTSSELMCIKSSSWKEQTLLGRNDDECPSSGFKENPDQTEFEEIVLKNVINSQGSILKSKESLRERKRSRQLHESSNNNFISSTLVARDSFNLGTEADVTQSRDDMLGNHCTISDSIANQLVSSGMNFDRKYGEVSPIAPDITESTDVCQSLNIENLSTFFDIDGVPSTNLSSSVNQTNSISIGSPEEVGYGILPDEDSGVVKADENFKVISTTVIKLEDNTLLQHALDQEKSFSKSNSTPIVETEGSYSKSSSAQMVDMESSSNRPSSTLKLEKERSFSKPSSINRINNISEMQTVSSLRNTTEKRKTDVHSGKYSLQKLDSSQKTPVTAFSSGYKRVTYIGGHSSGCIYKNVPHKHCKVDNASIGILQQLNARVLKIEKFLKNIENTNRNKTISELLDENQQDQSHNCKCVSLDQNLEKFNDRIATLEKLVSRAVREMQARQSRPSARKKRIAAVSSTESSSMSCLKTSPVPHLPTSLPLPPPPPPLPPPPSSQSHKAQNKSDRDELINPRLTQPSSEHQEDWSAFDIVENWKKFRMQKLESKHSRTRHHC